MKVKLFFGRLVTALLGGVIAVLLFVMFSDDKEVIIAESKVPEPQYASLPQVRTSETDLTHAAETSVKSVVHVKTLYTNQQYPSGSIYEFFFGNGGRERRSQPSLASGSGVIISQDGYIVTNNHVVKGANRINVVLNDKRSYEAKLIGQDASTDLALLKIDEEDLPYMEYGNSDQVKLGEWVLAVGNPFNLTSTVTAGIISAKARSIGIMRSQQMSIESFLQTDAAVNPGNSGGALVDTQGRLIGINTAIESRTGSYSGYSFAIPVTIVKKVIADLKEFGIVQRAMLGVAIQTIDAKKAEELGIDEIEGVLVADVNEGSAAEEGGLQAKDIILSVNGKKVNSTSELQEQVGRYRPGDEVKVLVKRDGEEKQFQLTLRNSQGSYEVIKQNDLSILGADFEPISKREMYQLGIRRGVKITDLRQGKLRSANIKEGFIIYKINDTPIYSEEDIKQAIMENNSEGVFISGIYPDGRIRYYAFSMKE
jgi:Do/DeqQ family serine protease